MSAHSHSADGTLSFKAGRLYRDGETNWVRPDLRKGECQMTFIGSGAVRLRWVEEKSTQTSDESIRPAQEEFVFFLGDAVAEKVAQSEGRVYVIKSKSTSTRLFFWLQDEDTGRDYQIEDAINAHLVADADRDTDDSEDEDDEELREAMALSRRTGEQLAVVRETPDLRAPILPTAQVGGNRGGNDIVMSPNDGGMDQLRQILSSFRVPEVTRGKSRLALQLGDVLTPEHLSSVLADPSVRRALLPTLPENIPRSSARDLENIVRSPQFQQALAALSYLLEDGQIAAVVGQLGLDPHASTSVAAFLEAVGKQVAQEKSSGSNNNNNKNNDDDEDATMQE
ncbi:hypothetical protein GGH94_001828 [Coemansia aciculifera]|uniref:Adhesion regulating molecule n=1 Tax=Coemansia aciculifera TaxID=417176 RepID=A0A9W8IRX6_9FUNG|nr:hypothetical protein GGH94_001828 [Coemansia aciculifera]